MTQPTPSSGDNGFAQMLEQITATATTDPQPKMNQHGQLDIYGIGQNSGEDLPIGRADDGLNKDAHGAGGDANGPGHSSAGAPYLVTVSTDKYLEALIKLSQTNPTQFTAIQQGLYNSGFYGNVSPAEVGFGRWSQKTKDALIGSGGALTNFLEVYKSGSTAMTFNEWLKKQADLAAADPNSPGNVAKGANKRAPLQLTDPSTINAAGDAVSDVLLGHALPAGQQQQLMSQFQGNEQSQYNAAGPTGSGATTTNQNPTDVARQFVANNNLPEYAAHQAEGYMNTFANMFLSGQSARANTSIGNVAVGSSH